MALHWVGPDGIILKANRRELEILGYAHAEYVGRHISEFHVSQEATADFLKRLSGGEILENYEAQLRRKDGSIRNVVIDSSVLWDNGRFIHTRCFTTDVTERKVADERMRILAHEVDHRARNLLSLVQATVHVTQADTVRALKAAIEGRIQALSNAHTLLAQSRWAGADLRSLVTQELSPFCPVGSSRADIKGPELILKPQTAQSIAMVLHELTTNAVKYGALSVPAGRVKVEWSPAAGERFVFRWAETAAHRSSRPPAQASAPVCWIK